MSNMTWQNYIDSEYNVVKYDINGTSYKEFISKVSGWGESDFVWYAALYEGEYDMEVILYYDTNSGPNIPRLNEYIIDGMNYIAE